MNNNNSQNFQNIEFEDDYQEPSEEGKIGCFYHYIKQKF